MNTVWEGSRHNWKPASLPAPLNGSDSLILAFKASQSISFDIDLEISGHSERFDCMLGASYSGADCNGQNVLLDATWEVNAQGRHIASGTSRGAFGASWGHDGMTKTIGTFTTQAGKDYSITVRFIKPLTPFANVAPVVSVRADRQVIKNASFKRGSGELDAVLVLIVGFVWLFIAKARLAQSKVISSLNQMT